MTQASNSTKVVLRRDYPKFKGRDHGNDIGMTGTEWLSKLEVRFLASNITDDEKNISNAKTAVGINE